MIYFYSDPHFFHDNIIRLASRPFDNELQMRHALEANYNRVVGDDDEVYFLGDIAYNRKKIKDGSLKGRQVGNILHRLKGRKYLVIGNHDEWLLDDPSFDQSLFEWIRPQFDLSYRDWTFKLIHDPVDFVPNYETGVDASRHLAGREILIYGHVHAQILADSPAKSYCVCVEQTGYAPIAIDKVLSELSL